MADARTSYDAVVVGGGPAGIFAAYRLVTSGRRVMLVEVGRPMEEALCPKVRVDRDGRMVRSSERLRQQCRRCTCLTGLGGAAFHFDTNLGYPAALSRSKIEQTTDGEVRRYSGLERALGSFERADGTLREVFDILYRHGLERPARQLDVAADVPKAHANFAGVDLSASQEITVDGALTVVNSLLRTFFEAGGELRYSTRASSIRRRRAGGFHVTLKAPTGTTTVDAATVAVAVGKLGLSWVRSLIADLGIAAPGSQKVDFGVRVEGPRDRLAPLSARCSNPKLAYLNQRGEAVRTFCVCPGGRIMQYAFEGAVVLDGQHCLTQPTRRSNFGIVTTLTVPSGVDGTDFALDLARAVSAVGGQRPVACTVGELRSSGRARGERPLDTSLVDHTRASLRTCLPDGVVDDVLEMVDRLDGTFPGMIGDETVVAAPVVERVYPQIALSPTMESSVPGLYFLGDASSKVIGVTYGAATGLVAADAILAGGAASRGGPGVAGSAPSVTRGA